MTIEFIVEDGSGKTDATSYASVTDYLQFWINRGVSETESADVIKGKLNLATEYLNNLVYVGSKATDAQALQWPRSYVKDYDSDEIPKTLINACCYLASQSARLNAVSEGVSSESFGPVSKTYNGRGVQFPLVDQYLKELLVPGNTLVRVN